MKSDHREVLFGEGKKDVGLIGWFMERVSAYWQEKEKKVEVYTSSLYTSDEAKKGQFPSIQIYPGGTSFERLNDHAQVHELEINLVVNTKGPSLEAFQQSSLMADEMYDHFRNIIPRVGPVRAPPVEGSIDYAWEGFHRKKHRNVRLQHSNVELVYKYAVGGKDGSRS